MVQLLNTSYYINWGKIIQGAIPLIKSKIVKIPLIFIMIPIQQIFSISFILYHFVLYVSISGQSILEFSMNIYCALLYLCNY